MKVKINRTGKVYEAKYFKDMTKEEIEVSVGVVGSMFNEEDIFVYSNESKLALSYFCSFEITVLKDEKPKMLFLYFGGSILNTFLENQIKKAELEIEIVRIDVSDKSNYIDFYQMTKHHAIIFETSDKEFISRLDGPFSSEDLVLCFESVKEQIEAAK